MARSDLLADAVLELLKAASVNDPPAVQAKGYAPRFQIPKFIGKRVYVFSGPGKTIAPLTRNKNLDEYKVSVVVLERYTEPAVGDADEPVPEEWVILRKSWVETYVEAILDAAGMDPTARVLSAFWPNRCEITTDFDRDILLEDKTFWSEVEIDYREMAAV